MTKYHWMRQFFTQPRPLADKPRLVNQSQLDKRIGRAIAIPKGVATPNRRKQAADATPQPHQNMRNLPNANPSAQSAKVSKRTVRPIGNPCNPNAIKVLGMPPNTMAIATRIGAFIAATRSVTLEGEGSFSLQPKIGREYFLSQAKPSAGTPRR